MPTYERNPQRAWMGCVARTAQGLVVLPPAAASVREGSGAREILAQVATRPALVGLPSLEYYAAALEFAGGADSEAVARAGTGSVAGLSSTELFYSEMINLELKPRRSEDPDAEFAVRMRDGRELWLKANAEFIDRAAGALRATKAAVAEAPAMGHNRGAGDDKVCPMCAETVRAAALICRYCRHTFARE